MSVAYQTARAPAFRGRRLTAALARGVSNWWRSYTTWRSRQLAAVALRRLDDRMLKDIGIERSEINSVVHTGGRGRTVHVAR